MDHRLPLASLRQCRSPAGRPRARHLRVRSCSSHTQQHHSLTLRRIGFVGYSEQYRIAGIIVEAALLVIIAFTNNVMMMMLSTHSLTGLTLLQYILWRERRLRYSEFAAKVRHLYVS